MDRKEVTALVLLDLSKAFDSIQPAHVTLLKKKKLRAMGISRDPAEWSVSEN